VAMIQKRAVNMVAVRKHIEVSDIRMKDTSVAGTSTYARFDAAYDAILCCGLALLELSRQEVTTDKGHHLEILQFLVDTLKFKGQNASDIKAAKQSLQTLRRHSIAADAARSKELPELDNMLRMSVATKL